jgi:hypothetical protein
MKVKWFKENQALFQTLSGASFATPNKMPHNMITLIHSKKD